jgi:hypothetical protein
MSDHFFPAQLSGAPHEKKAMVGVSEIVEMDIWKSNLCLYFLEFLDQETGVYRFTGIYGEEKSLIFVQSF